MYDISKLIFFAIEQLTSKPTRIRFIYFSTSLTRGPFFYNFVNSKNKKPKAYYIFKVFSKLKKKNCNYSLQRADLDYIWVYSNILNILKIINMFFFPREKTTVYNLRSYTIVCFMYEENRLKYC